MIIAIEGIDGVGKSTLANKFSHLGKVIHFPTVDVDWSKPPEKLIPIMLKDMKDTLTPLVDKDELIILDRYYLSTYVYQCYATGKPELWNEFEDLVNELPEPNFTVILELPAEEALKRSKGGYQEDQGLEYMQRISEGYRKAYCELPNLRNNSVFYVLGLGEPFLSIAYEDAEKEIKKKIRNYERSKFIASKNLEG